MFQFSFTSIFWRVVVTVSCLVSLVQKVSSDKFTATTIHKTKDALEVKSDLHCYTCDIFNDPDSCINILNVTDSERVKYTQKCTNEHSFCSVRRYSYTMTDKNSTSEKRLWSLSRNCTAECENGCIIIGERVKLHACSSCCNTSYCNIGNGAPS